MDTKQTVEISETVVLTATGNYCRLRVELDRQFETLSAERFAVEEFAVANARERSRDLAGLVLSVRSRSCDLAACLGLFAQVLLFDSIEQ